MHIIQTLFEIYMHSKGEFELLETEKAVYETDFGEIAIEIPGKLTNSPDLMEHNAYNNDFFIFLYAFSEETGGCELANSHGGWRYTENCALAGRKRVATPTAGK